MRSLAQQFERDPVGAEKQARDLAGIAGSLGGARPKANVEGDHLEACNFFGVEPDSAKQQGREMAELIIGNWRQALREEGASSDEIHLYSDAFEHAATEKALSLDH